MSDKPEIKPEEWVDEYGTYLYKYALMRLRDPATAHDVVQETFLAALKGKAVMVRSAYEQPLPPPAELMAIASGLGRVPALARRMGAVVGVHVDARGACGPGCGRA